MDEILVSNQNPKDYLRKTIVLSNSEINKNTLLKGYCREKVKINVEDYKVIDEIKTLFKVKIYVQNAKYFETIENLLNNENYEFKRKIKEDLNGEP